MKPYKTYLHNKCQMFMNDYASLKMLSPFMERYWLQVSLRMKTS